MTVFDLIPWRRSQTYLPDVRRFFNDVFDDNNRWPSLMDNDRKFVPSIEVQDEATAFTVKAEVPGMDQKDLEVVFDNGDLIIRGEKKEETTEEDKAKGTYRSECRYGKFERRLPFGNTVDRAKVDANYKNGVLTIKLPRTNEAQQAKKQIAIKAS